MMLSPRNSAPSTDARVKPAHDGVKHAVPAMSRREFITLSAGAAIAWPLAARAQQAGKLPTIGYIGGGGSISQRAWVDAFVQRLRELGWIDGRTVAIEYRWGEGRPERYAEFAAEFVRRKVDVIFANGTEPAVAAKQATSVIPIIFPAAGDPVGSRLVASLARPGGNVTGLSNQGTDLAAKRLEILREVFPDLRRLAVMANIDFSAAAFERTEIDAAARTLGLEIVPLPIRRAEDIASAFDGLKARAQAFYATADPLVNLQRVRINIFALAGRLPTMFSQREYVEAGGLMSYGANVADLNRRAADYVDKVLRGAKPADLPVEQPTKFDLTVSLITAKALGVTVPPMLLARADEVIE
jgi:putative tryptophan/tyrosine transport system substrate-binding protein